MHNYKSEFPLIRRKRGQNGEVRGGEANAFGRGGTGRPAKMSGEFDNVGRICYNKNAIFRKDVPHLPGSAGRERGGQFYGGGLQ